MTPADLLASARSLIEGDPNSAGLIDRFTVVNRTYADDGQGGQTPSDATVASNVPGLYEDADYSTSQVAGGHFAHVTHELFLIASAATRVMKPTYLITKAARDDDPAKTFEQPVLLEETFGPLVHVGAKLRL